MFDGFVATKPSSSLAHGNMFFGESIAGLQIITLHVAVPLHALTKAQEWSPSWRPGRSIHWDGQACGTENVGISGERRPWPPISWYLLYRNGQACGPYSRGIYMGGRMWLRMWPRKSLCLQ